MTAALAVTPAAGTPTADLSTDYSDETYDVPLTPTHEAAAAKCAALREGR